ncbi:carbohydrate porin [soil metagenome]
MNTKTGILGLAAGFLLGAFPAGIQAGQTVTTTTEKPSESPLNQWWNGKYASGNWFGLRDTLEDHGLNLGASWRANFLGIVDGGTQQRAGFDEEFKFFGTLDFAKATGVEALEGLTAYSSVRWRDGNGVNKYAGTTSNFGPSTYQNGKQWRFQVAYLTYTTPELFGVKNFLTLSGGWQNPSDHFLTQPESKFFVNNTFTSGRGIGANGIPWGSAYAAWGGYATVKPTDWFYVQSGLYLAIPFGTDTHNHGLDFQGYHPDPDLNGLFWLTEAGVTPKIGPAELPGRYAAGFIYWGVENKSYRFNQVNDERLLLYWQADQMLFREPSQQEASVLGKGPSDGKTVASGKSFKDPVSEKTKLSDQGLYFFSLLNFAPAYNNAVPFYFHTGLIYKGLIPGRDDDQLGAAIAYGNYSFDNIEVQQSIGNTNQQNYTAVLEFDYRIQVTKFAYVQPLVQYIIHPSGSGAVQNDTILGVHMGVNF